MRINSIVTLAHAEYIYFILSIERPAESDLKNDTYESLNLKYKEL